MTGRRGGSARWRQQAVRRRHRKSPRGVQEAWARAIADLPEDELLVVRLVQGNALYAWVCTFDHLGAPVMSWSAYAFEWRDDATLGASLHWEEDHGGRAPGVGYRFLRPRGPSGR
jgi:hypothetical protein